MGKGGKLRKKPGAHGQFKGKYAKAAKDKSFEDVVTKLKLDKAQRQILHKEVGGEGLDYHGILDVARELFGK
jgi:hypothetical protein